MSRNGVRTTLIAGVAVAGVMAGLVAGTAGAASAGTPAVPAPGSPNCPICSHAWSWDQTSQGKFPTFGIFIR